MLNRNLQKAASNPTSLLIVAIVNSFSCALRNCSFSSRSLFDAHLLARLISFNCSCNEETAKISSSILFEKSANRYQWRSSHYTWFRCWVRLRIRTIGIQSLDPKFEIQTNPRVRLRCRTKSFSGPDSGSGFLEDGKPRASASKLLLDFPKFFTCSQSFERFFLS